MSCSINQQWSYLISELRYFAFVTPTIYHKSLFKLEIKDKQKTSAEYFPQTTFSQKKLKAECFFTGVNYLNDFIGVINTAFPGAAAHGL